MATQRKIMGSFNRYVALDPLWTQEIPTWLDPSNLVRLLNYKDGYYVDGRVEKSFDDLNIFTRTGVTWAWQMVSGALELVEIADGVAPFSVDPETGLVLGVDVMPAVTRSNIRYMPSAAQMTASGSPTITDLALNALGHFASVKIESGGSTSDYAASQAADNVNLASGTPQAFEFLIREDNLGVVRLGLQAQTSGNTLILEYTFATSALTTVSITAGTVALEQGVELVDGTHRITGVFTPNATDGYKAIWLPNSGISGEGFICSAWFVYGSAVSSGCPIPVLGAQGATYSTNDGPLTGIKAVGPAQALVIFGRHLIHKTNWSDLVNWYEASNTGNVFAIDTHLAGSGYRTFINHATDTDVTNWPTNTLDYGARFGIAIAKAQDIQRSTIHVQHSDAQETFTTQGAYSLDEYGVGCLPSGTSIAGATIEKLMLLDICPTQAQVTALAEMGF